MTGPGVADAWTRQADTVLDLASGFTDRGFPNLAVRAAQDAVELALKGTLRSLGIDVPRVHDLSAFLRARAADLPAGLAPDLDRLVAVCRRLGVERGRAFYGDELAGVPASALDAPAEAEQAVEDARWVVALCRSLGVEPA